MSLKAITAAVCGTAVLGIALVVPATAEVAESGPARSELQEIIVTAQRKEERLQDVPISITVFNQQQLNNQNIVNGSDLATYVPSLSSNDRFGQDNAAFAIRGFTQELRTTASVGVYFAEVVAPRAGQNSITAGDGAGPGDLFDLENVQVLKGPQGTLFGRNTTGGAVLLVPRKPTNEVAGYFEGSAGDFGLERFQGVLNVPLNSKLRFRVGVDQNKRDGYLNNESGIGPRHQGSLDYTAVRASLVADLTDSVENYTIYSYTHSDGSPTFGTLFVCNPGVRFASFCQAQLAREGNGFYTTGADIYNPSSDIHSSRVINTTTWNATPDFRVKNIFAYSTLKTVLVSPVFGTDFRLPSALPGIGGLPFIFANSDPVPGYPSTNQKNFVEELQLQGQSFHGTLDWQGGLYFEKSLPRTLAGSLADAVIYCPPGGHVTDSPPSWACQDVVRGAALFGPPFNGHDPGFNVFPPVAALNQQLGEITFVNKAIYLQATYRISDALRFTGGVRYTADDTNSTGSQIAYRGFPAATLGAPTITSCVLTTATLPGCLTYLTQRSRAPTGTAGLDYFVTPESMVYGKYTRGYRQGAINLFGAEGFQTYQPEHVDTYEIGSKTSFAGRLRGTFNVAAFYNELTNQQLQEGFNSVIVNPTTGIVNAGKSTIWGIEVESHLVPIERVSLDLGYTYLHTKLDQITPVTIPAGSVYNALIPSAVQGGPLVMSPHHKAVLTTTYQLPLPDAIGAVSLGATDVYTSSQLATAGSPYGVLPGYNLVNFNLNWNGILGGPLDASVFVTNAFEKHYTTFVPGFFATLGAEFHNVGYPRMIGARVRYSFGAK